MRFVIAFFVGLFVTACSRQPVLVERTNNPEIVVEKLFTYDGCNVYRFNDGNSRYFAKCGQVAADTNWNETCGKGCSRNVGVIGANK